MNQILFQDGTYQLNCKHHYGALMEVVRGLDLVAQATVAKAKAKGCIG